MPMMDKEKLYIIGAGISGLTAAYYAAKTGRYDITIYEASPQPGGRCRSYFDEKLRCEIDNGNHLIMGANENVLGLIKELGVYDRLNKFSDKTFRFYHANTGSSYQFKAPFPAIKTFGLNGIFTLIKFLLCDTNKTVTEYFKNSPKLYEKLINPISRSILNTPSEYADANILRKVFLKIFKTQNGFDYYYPIANWHNSLIAPLVDALDKMGAKINYDKRVKEMIFENDIATKLIFDTEQIDISSAKTVLATPSQVSSKLLNITTPDEFEPIVNIHFRIDHYIKPQIYGVINGPLEWLFVKPDMVSTTYSAASDILNFDQEKMAADVWNTCAKLLTLPTSPVPPHRILIEKRATFACTKEQLAKRPSQKTAYKNLYLAGDYTSNSLPATIEGAALSGKIAADFFLFQT